MREGAQHTVGRDLQMEEGKDRQEAGVCGSAGCKSQQSPSGRSEGPRDQWELGISEALWLMEPQVLTC